MEDALLYLYTGINVFMLIIARMIGLFIVSPIFGRNNIPAIMKITLCLFISYLIFPSVMGTSFNIDFYNMNTILVVLYGIKEFVVGLSIGFIAYIMFGIFFMAGSYLDMEMGLSMATMFDPQYGGQVPLSGNLIYIYATLIFLVIDGHHYLIKILVNSFQLFPLDGILKFDGNFLDFTINLVNFIFFMSLKLIIPIFVGLVITNIVLGFLARTMPQMNIFVVGVQVKIVVGLGLLIILTPFMVTQFKTVFMTMYKYMYEYLRIIRG